MSIRSRLLLLVLVFAAPLIGVLAWYAQFTYKSEMDASRRSLETLARMAILDLRDAAEGGKQLLSGLSNVPQLHGTKTPACDAILAAKFVEFPKYTGILTFDTEGNLVCDALFTNRPQNFSYREYFQRARATGNTVVGSPVFGTLTKKAVLPILHPMLGRESKIEGYLYASYDLKQFATELHRSLHPTAVFAVWGPDSTLMARYPELPAMQGKSAKGSPVEGFLANSAAESTAEFVDFDGVNRIWAVAKLPDQFGSDGWITVAFAREEAVAVAQGATRPLLVSITVGVLVALAAALIFADTAIRQPVKRLMQAIRRFESGDRGVRIGAPYPRGELGQLMKAADHIAALGEEEHRQLLALTDQLEQKVDARTAELTASNQELEAFCYSISHDLRAPLRHVQGFSSMLRQDHQASLAPEALRYLDRIEAATARMGTLIDDLLHLSRVTRADLRRTHVDLSEAATRVLGELAQRDPDRKVESQVAAGLVVHGDGHLLHIAIENLLGNAWKFTSTTAGAQIEVGCRHEADEMICWIRDNGVGFDMNYATKLFRPFQRLHRADEFAGTGIGLVTVHRIITRLGGRVWIEGAEGKGTTVYFALPAVAEQTA